MVTMLAHGTLCRFAVSSKTATRDLPQLARFLGRSLPSRNASSLATVRALSRAYASALQARRNYATTARATQPTATVKKAVKAKAAGKAPPRKTAAAKTTTKSAKKPAASKAKAKPKKKAPKKAAPKKRVVKELTPEQKERANVQKEKAKLAELRRMALKEPHKGRTVSAHVVYIGEQIQGKSGGKATTLLADANKKWKTLTPAEVEHYNHLARETTATRQAEYRAWLHSHTPRQIHEANIARSKLRSIFKTAEQKLPSNTKKLIDERQPKRTKAPFMYFTSERYASGDFKNIGFIDVGKLVGQEWNALSAGEKKKYTDASAADHARYKREVAAMSG